LKKLEARRVDAAYRRATSNRDIERRSRLPAVPALNIQFRKTATSERLSSGRLEFTNKRGRIPGFVRKCFHFSQQYFSMHSIGRSPAFSSMVFVSITGSLEAPNAL
jgi:hypothetical protein